MGAGDGACGMSKRRTLNPGDAYAMPLFGEAEPAAQSLFGSDVGTVASPAVPAMACPACGAVGDHPCRGVAIALELVQAPTGERYGALDCSRCAGAFRVLALSEVVRPILCPACRRDDVAPGAPNPYRRGQ